VGALEIGPEFVEGGGDESSCVAVDLRDVVGVEGESFEECELDAVAGGVDGMEMPPLETAWGFGLVSGFFGPSLLGGAGVETGETCGSVGDGRIGGGHVGEVCQKILPRRGGGNDGMSIPHSISIRELGWRLGRKRSENYEEAGILRGYYRRGNI
jgi:hypothetical protein